MAKHPSRFHKQKHYYRTETNECQSQPFIPASPRATIPNLNRKTKDSSNSTLPNVPQARVHVTRNPFISVTDRLENIRMGLPFTLEMATFHLPRIGRWLSATLGGKSTDWNTIVKYPHSRTAFIGNIWGYNGLTKLLRKKCRHDLGWLQVSTFGSRPIGWYHTKS